MKDFLKKNIKKQHIVILGILFVALILASGFMLINGYKKIEAQSAQFLASGIVKNCHTKINWQLCYANKLSELNTHIPFNLSMQVFYAIQRSDPQTEKCHLIVHKLGGSEIAKNPEKWLSMFEYIPDSNMCFTGFIHGAMEGKQRYDSKFKLTTQTANEMCNQIKTIMSNDNMYPCGHGLGHIILVEENNDLPKATKMCTGLQEGLRRYCLDGLFMEYIFKSNLIDHGMAPPIRENEQYARQIENVCKSFRGEKATSCWREISMLYFKLAGPDFTKLKNYCERGVLNENVEACYFRVLSVAIMDQDFDKNQLSAMCGSFSSETDTFSLCYDWAITGIIYTDPKLVHLVDNICQEAPDSFKNECWKMRDERIKMYRPSNKKTF